MMDEPTDATTNVGDAPRKERKPRTQKYVVQKAAIAPEGGSRSLLTRPGETVSLTAEQAKHYNKLGFLAPLIED